VQPVNLEVFIGTPGPLTLGRRKKLRMGIKILVNIEVAANSTAV